MVLEKRSEGRMRDLVMAIGGPLRFGENRKSWLARIARQTGITARAAKSAYYGELHDDHRVFWKLREAQRQQQREDADARDELATIKARLSILESRLSAQETNGDREIDYGAHSEMHRSR